jgi:hypothetical protein
VGVHKFKGDSIVLNYKTDSNVTVTSVDLAALFSLHNLDFGKACIFKLML